MLARRIGGDRLDTQVGGDRVLIGVSFNDLTQDHRRPAEGQVRHTRRAVDVPVDDGARRPVKPFGGCIVGEGEGTAGNDTGHRQPGALELVLEGLQVIDVLLRGPRPFGWILEVLVTVVGVQPRRLKSRCVVDGAVHLLGGALQSRARAVHSHVQVEHYQQGAVAAGSGRCQRLHVSHVSHCGTDPSLGMGVGNLREAAHFEVLHHRVGEDRLGGAGVEGHLELPQGGTLEPGDPGCQLFAHDGCGLVRLYMRHQVGTAVNQLAERGYVGVHLRLENHHGRRFDGVRIGDEIGVVLDHLGLRFSVFRWAQTIENRHHACRVQRGHALAQDYLCCSHFPGPHPSSHMEAE